MPTKTQNYHGIQINISPSLVGSRDLSDALMIIHIVRNLTITTDIQIKDRKYEARQSTSTYLSAMNMYLKMFSDLS